MQRTLIPTTAPWAKTVGYSRAVRVGNHVYVAGTAPVAEDGSVVAPGDAYLQAKRCLEIILNALHAAGAEARHVVRTRMFVRKPEMWDAVGRAHGEIFGDVLPATTMVFVDFIHPEMMVEIEADAVLD
ncbi:MAG TPA: RidA family protein [Longimicrobiales bacterium]